MAKYLIHSCEKRKWYVDNFLIPSMLEQGIERENITVHNDASNNGCLQSYILSIDMINTVAHGTWHLQDDIIISSNFKEITESYDKGIVCGFCSYYSEDLPIGIRSIKDMWYSFPCIRIPNCVAKGFVKWLKSSKTQKKYQYYISHNKFVDYLFYIYVTEYHKDRVVHNLCPNIVDNIDYLLGGSTISKRDMLPTSLYFSEKDLIGKLKCSIKNSVYNAN